MKLSKQAEKEFREFEKKIERLEQATIELNALNAPPQVFGSDMDSMRQKLRSPGLVDEVEKDLSTLKQKVAEYRGSSPSGWPSAIAGFGPEVPPLELSAELARYTIHEKLGSGGFADVHRAERDDGLVVALKVPRLAANETFVPTDFLKEAELWSKLNHDHIVKVHEYGARPYPWLAMECMENGSLRGKIGSLSVAQSLDIAAKLAHALFYAHHHGVIHRDIKPENILFDSEDTPKFTDWGLGKVLLDRSSSAAGFKGTLAYSAPEQLASSKFGEVDWRTDIYQLGTVLYEMLAGRWVITSDEPGATVTQILNEEVEAPSKAVGGIPDELDKIVLRAIAKKKEDRYQDVSALAEELEKALKHVKEH